MLRSNWETRQVRDAGTFKLPDYEVLNENPGLVNWIYKTIANAGTVILREQTQD